MKIPSFGILISTTAATFKRFYTASLFALLASVFCILIFHMKGSQDGRYQYYLNVIMSSYLGMLLSLSATLFCERKKSGKPVKTGLQIVTVILSVIYYFSLPHQYNVASLIKFELYIIALHLLIAFAPFTSRGEMNGFWQYNKTLFLRFLTTALYAMVLYLGLALALLAIEELFKVKIDGKYYGDLWILTGGLFSICFFLAEFPAGFDKLEMKRDYPKGLKIFTQYILLPIITIYLLILYTYMFKIIFTLKWPFGWVSYLVLALSVAGILSLLLIHPERHIENNKWILIYSRFFYFALCPLIILLFLAIERRVSDYGITESRYFVLALSCWLALTVMYFLFSKKKNIKIIPVSLCCLAVLCSFGPWGAFAISLKSQQKNLFRLLERNHLLYRQKFRPVKDKIPAKDAYRINSIVEYLVENHGYASLQPLFPQNLDSLMKSERNSIELNSYAQSSKIEALMHIQHSDADLNSQNQHSFNFSTDQDRAATRLTGYDFLVTCNFRWGTVYQQDSFLLDKNRFLVNLDKKTNKLMISLNGGTPLSLDFFPLIESFRNKSYTQFTRIDPEEMLLVSGNKDMSVKVFLRTLIGNDDKNNGSIEELNADILIKIRE